MKLDILEAGGFGKFSQRSFIFKPGLNLIYGNNEAGKSTILTLIELLLYGAKKEGITVKKYSEAHEKYMPWSSEIYQGSLGFTLDSGRKLEVFRDFNKNKEEFRLYDLNGGKDISADFRVDKRGEVLFAEKLFNMSRSVFLNTVMISQMDIVRGFDGNVDELSAGLLKAVSGAGKDNSTARALNLLESALNRIGKTDRGKRSGELALEIRQLEEEFKNVREKRASLVQRQELLKELEAEEILLQNSLEGIEFSRTGSKIKELKSAVEKSKVLEQKIAEDEKVLQSYQEFKDFPLESYETASRLEEAKKEKKSHYNQLANKLEEVDQELQQVKAELQTIAPYRSLLENGSDEILELKTSWQEAEKNIAEVRSQIENEQDKTSTKQQKLDELEKLFKALGQKSGEGLQRLNVEIDEIEEHLNEITKEIGSSSNESQKNKSMALNFAIIAFFTSISGALLSASSLLNIHFPIYIPTLLSLISAGFIVPAFQRQKRVKKILEEINIKEKEFETLDSKRKLIKKEIATFFSLAGVNDTAGFLRLEAEYNSLKELLADNSVMIQQKRLPRLEDDLLELKEKIMIRLRFVGLGMDNTPASIERDIVTFRDNFRKKVELELTLQNLRNKKEELIAELKRLERQIEETRNKLKTIYSVAKCSGFIEFAAAKESRLAWNKADASLRGHQRSLGDILNDRSLDEIVKELEKLTKLFGGQVEENGGNRFDLNDEKAAREKLEYNQKKIGPLKGEIAEMQRESRDLGIIEAELQQAKAEFDAIEERRNSLKLAVNGINEASERLHASFAPILNEGISKMVTAISGGKYNEVMVSDDFRIAVRESLSRRIISVSSLSSGAQDQVFFSSRIALADALTQNNEMMPLFLDDTFVESDLSRLKQTYKIIDGIARERQVLLFTCHQRELELARQQFGDKLNLINLQD